MTKASSHELFGLSLVRRHISIYTLLSARDVASPPWLHHAASPAASHARNRLPTRLPSRNPRWPSHARRARPPAITDGLPKFGDESFFCFSLTRRALDSRCNPSVSPLIRNCRRLIHLYFLFSFNARFFSPPSSPAYRLTSPRTTPTQTLETQRSPPRQGRRSPPPCASRRLRSPDVAAGRPWSSLRR